MSTQCDPTKLETDKRITLKFKKLPNTNELHWSIVKEELQEVKCDGLPVAISKNKIQRKYDALNKSKHWPTHKKLKKKYNRSWKKYNNKEILNNSKVQSQCEENGQEICSQSDYEQPSIVKLEKFVDNEMPCTGEEILNFSPNNNVPPASASSLPKDIAKQISELPEFPIIQNVEIIYDPRWAFHRIPPVPPIAPIAMPDKTEQQPTTMNCNVLETAASSWPNDNEKHLPELPEFPIIQNAQILNDPSWFMHGLSPIAHPDEAEQNPATMQAACTTISFSDLYTLSEFDIDLDFLQEIESELAEKQIPHQQPEIQRQQPKQEQQQQQQQPLPQPYQEHNVTSNGEEIELNKMCKKYIRGLNSGLNSLYNSRRVLYVNRSGAVVER